MDQRIKDSRLIVSTSGGKDSTAMCLMLMEMGYSSGDYDRVFFDTGWEHKDTYDYLDELEKTVGKIHRCKARVKVRPERKEFIDHIEKMMGFESPMIRRIIHGLFFSSRLKKWCTSELKIKPAKSFFEKYEDEIINVVGIRKEESPRRAAMKEWEWSEAFDCWTWRPLIEWTEKDVIDIHHRFNLKPNPLYLKGANRVGCWPCIMSKKKEIAQLDDTRIAVIRELELYVEKMRGPDKHPSSFFQTRTKEKTMKIDAVMSWSKTARGGKQYELFNTGEPTCVKWGLCNI